MDTDGRAVTLPPHALSSSESRDHTSLDGAVVKKTSEETLSARLPPEEQERGDDSQLTADNSASVGKGLSCSDKVTGLSIEVPSNKQTKQNNSISNNKENSKQLPRFLRRDGGHSLTTETLNFLSFGK